MEWWGATAWILITVVFLVAMGIFAFTATKRPNRR